VLYATNNNRFRFIKSSKYVNKRIDLLCLILQSKNHLGFYKLIIDKDNAFSEEGDHYPGFKGRTIESREFYWGLLLKESSIFRFFIVITGRIKQ
jgi:hypothetical protein